VREDKRFTHNFSTILFYLVAFAFIKLSPIPSRPGDLEENDDNFFNGYVITERSFL